MIAQMLDERYRPVFVSRDTVIYQRRETGPLASSRP
jgi:hypothetical protein